MGKNSLTEQQLFKLQQKFEVIDPFMDQKLKKGLGIPIEKNNIKAPKKTYSGKEKDHIEWVLIGMKLDYKKEYKFHPTRKFRFDFCLVDKKVAIEYNGIMGDKSRHTTISGYSNDMNKINIAVVNGWRVLQYTPLNYLTIGTDLEKLLNLTK